MRHNEIRDVEASLIREVCHDVQVEPALIPLNGQQFHASANHIARLDVSDRGLWAPMERAFFDVRIFHPNTDSNRSKSLPQLFNIHEAEKKRTYNQSMNMQRSHPWCFPLVEVRVQSVPDSTNDLQYCYPAVAKKAMQKPSPTSVEESVSAF